MTDNSIPESWGTSNKNSVVFNIDEDVLAASDNNGIPTAPTWAFNAVSDTIIESTTTGTVSHPLTQEAIECTDNNGTQTVERITFEQVEDAIVSPGTRTRYLARLLAFFFYLQKQDSPCLTPLCKDLLSTYEQSANIDINKIINKSKSDFIERLRRADERPLLYLDQLTPRLFFDWLLSLRNTRNGSEYLGKSSYNQRRSALYHCFRLHNRMGCDDKFKRKLDILFDGLYRVLADAKAAKKVKIDPNNATVKWNPDESKEPMSVALYSQTCRWLLSQGTADSIAAHCYLVLTWNLACRSQNTADIRLSDISWNHSFDAFSIRFAHTKTDQQGEEAKYDRHCFANPTKESRHVCPVLALALHLSCNFNKTSLPMDCLLFPGTFQKDRFGKTLKRLFEENKEEIKTKFGYDLDDLGTHSIRKGAATYLASIPGGPSAISCCIRGGWTIGNVKERYFKYSEAGDQFVGRCLSLLNILSVEFSVSPPFFECSDENQNGFINNLILAQFPALSNSANSANSAKHGKLLRMMLASILFHRNWLLDSDAFGHNHVVKKCCYSLRKSDIDLFLVNNPMLLSTKFPYNDNQNKYTGIPPHVILLNEMAALKRNQDILLETFVEKVKEALKDYGVNEDRVTEHRLRVVLDDFKADLSLQLKALELKSQQTTLDGDMQMIQNDIQHDNEDFMQRPETRNTYPPHCFGGSLHRVPKTWRWPRCGCLHLWRQWWLGDDVQNVPPLRFLKIADIRFLDAIPLSKEEMQNRSGRYSMQRRKTRKTLADVRYLMNAMTFMVKRANAYRNVINVTTVDFMFQAIEEELITQAKDLRKDWHSIIKYVRKLVPTIPQTNNTNESNDDE
jgi:hypothetical protein